MKKIAYCPTMEPFAEKIRKKSKKVEMIPMGSAAQVLSMLRNGDIDGVLIGRYAKKRELDSSTKRHIFHEGYTLIHSMKQGIDVKQLKRIPIKTYIAKNKIKHIMPLLGEVEFFDSFENCLAGGWDTPVLIDWKDYRDEFELLIPMNSFGKIPVFRAPVLYYKDIDSEIINQMKKYI